MIERMFLHLLSDDLVDRIDRWPALKQWERRELGEQLRLLGLSYREIGQVIPVSKGTLSKWCRDIELTEEQQARLELKRPALAVRRRLGAERRMRARSRRAASRSAAAAEAVKLLTDSFWVGGVVAYWAEGAKSQHLRFANSDPAMIKLFIAWSREYLGLDADRFTVALHLHSGQDEAERKEYWSYVTELPLEQFRKSFIKPQGTGHRKNVLYNGTAMIGVSRSGELLDRVLGWMDAVSKRYAFVG
jgi:hypothetical protein